MNKISLVASVHSERGKCNSYELYKIIEHIAPDVIFEEISPELFEAIYNGSREDHLETKTIKQYLQKHQVAHVPVDLDVNDLIDKRLKTDIDNMHDIFFDNIEYQSLSNHRKIMSEQYGFPFLNSDQCRQIMDRRRKLESKMVSIINNEKLSQVFTTWLDILDKRENVIIKNIYKYSAENKYYNALFLVGAEHIKPIIDKLPNFEKNSSLKLKWDFK